MRAAPGCGNVYNRGGKWFIQCPPHLKVFVSKKQVGLSLVTELRDFMESGMLLRASKKPRLCLIEINMNFKNGFCITSTTALQIE